MDSTQWLELYEGPWTVTGNAAKAKVQQELWRLLSMHANLRILDVGCVGLAPLEFWEPLLGRYSFHLTGVDVRGVERAERIVRERGWEKQVTLLEGSGYRLKAIFTAGSFDVVVATQVLEHVARLPSFLEQVAAVLRRNGEVFLTGDSAHWQSRYDRRMPVRMIKNVVKKGLSLLGYEYHYDLPWSDREVVIACQRAGLDVVACRYYNLAPLKFLHNRIVTEERKNVLLRAWLELEELLNDDDAVRGQARHLFMGIYVHARRPE
jgi:cyclopropane fatty-acyl-phospholipid synthase-like methyltransferase